MQPRSPALIENLNEISSFTQAYFTMLTIIHTSKNYLMVTLVTCVCPASSCSAAPCWRPSVWRGHAPGWARRVPPAPGHGCGHRSLCRYPRYGVDSVDIQVPCPPSSHVPSSGHVFCTQAGDTLEGAELWSESLDRCGAEAQCSSCTSLYPAVSLTTAVSTPPTSR